MFLLDTDTIIYSLKGNESVIRNLETHLFDPLRISVITLMELYYGAHKSKKVTENMAKVRRIESTFNILPIDVSVCDTFGMIKSQLEAIGTPLDDFDLALAATALTYNLILVTNNEKHFRRIEGLKIENWAFASHGC